jgi:chemotaxis protein CheD
MKHIVGIAEMKVASAAGDEIVTYALGSCVGISVYDPVSKVGGLLHIMLPTGSIDAEKAIKSPYMFADTGVPKFFQAVYSAGGAKERLIVKIAGGAATKGAAALGSMAIGQKNIAMVRKLFWQNSVMIKAQDVGGDAPRTMLLSLESGKVTITSGVKTTEL